MKKLLSITAVLIFAILSFGLYQYSRAPVNLKNQKAEITLTATELKEQLAKDTSARSRFSNKIILVEGTISSVEQGEHVAITIDSCVRGELERNILVPEPGQTIRLKGILGGYDEIFEEVVMIKCELEE